MEEPPWNGSEPEYEPVQAGEPHICVHGKTASGGHSRIADDDVLPFALYCNAI